MARFRLEIDGHRFSIEAPDLESAIAGAKAFRDQGGGPDPDAAPSTGKPPTDASGRPLQPFEQPDEFGILPQGEAGADPARLSARFPLRAAGRMGAQALGTGAGIVGGGAVAGPVGAMAGGAVGSVAAGQAFDAVADRIMGTQERPPLASVETAIDAATGAAGPLASSLARPVGRLVSGVSRSAAERVTVGSHRALGRRFLDNLPSDEIRAEMARAEQRLAERAAAEATRAMTAPANWLAAIAGISSGSIPVAGGVLVVGHARRKLAERLLQNPAVREWAQRTGPQFGTRAQISTSLAAIAANDAFDAETRDTARSLRGAIGGPDPATLKAGSLPRTPAQAVAAAMSRDARSGKFVAFDRGEFDRLRSQALEPRDARASEPEDDGEE